MFFLVKCTYISNSRRSGHQQLQCRGGHIILPAGETGFGRLHLARFHLPFSAHDPHWHVVRKRVQQSCSAR